MPVMFQNSNLDCLFLNIDQGLKLVAEMTENVAPGAKQGRVISGADAFKLCAETFDLINVSVSFALMLIIGMTLWDFPRI